jgi:hypothetical protein
MASDARSEQTQAFTLKYSQPSQLSPIPESGTAARGHQSALLPNDSGTSVPSGKNETLLDTTKPGRKRSKHEAMLQARNQRIARFRADYTARKGSHRFASIYYSSHSTRTVSGSNTSDASDNCENEVHLSNWKLKRIKVGEVRDAIFFFSACKMYVLVT